MIFKAFYGFRSSSKPKIRLFCLDNRKFVDKPKLHDGDNFAAAYTKIIVRDLPV